VNHLLIALSLIVTAQVTDQAPTLPASATAPLRSALSTNNTLLDGRLTLTDAIVETSTVTVSFAAQEGGASGITVVLGHPSQAPEGRPAGPFVILRHDGGDEAAVADLVTRLSALTSAEIWQSRSKHTADAETSKAPYSAPVSAAERRAGRLLWQGRQAVSVGATKLAKQRFDALSLDPELPPSAMLELAEGYRRINGLEETTKTLARWKQTTINDITSPVETAQYEALSGHEVSVLKVLQDARVSHNACGFDALARAMDAIGHRTEAYLLLDSAARKTDCPEVEATLLEWFIADGRLYEAEQLSAILAQHYGSHPRIAAVRSMLLLEMDKPDAVIALLKPLLDAHPNSSLLSFYIIAQRVMIQGEGALEALGAKSDEAIDDGLLALTVAVGYQERGDDDTTARYLQRAEATFAGHRLVKLLEARLTFNRGDRLTVATLLEAIDAMDAPDVSSPLDAEVEALRGELLRWTDPPAARDTLRHTVLLAAKHSQGTVRLARRAKAQGIALEGCLKDKASAPCRGPFLYPAGHPSNEAFDDSEDDTGGFGNWLIIVGILLLFMMMVRQSRMKRQRGSRWK
jgi:hypothetical protein